MADEPQTPPENEEELLLTEVHEPGGEPSGDPDEGDEVEIPSFGDEAEPREDDTNLIKHLREQIRERDRKLAEAARPKEQPVDPGPEPTLEDCDYDEDKLKIAVREWDKKVAEAKKPATDANAAAQQQWERERARYTDGKEKLRAAIPDIDDAEETVRAALSPEQQTVLVLATDDPAKMMVALANNPAKLAELAGESDFFKLAAKAAKLEGQLKMVKRRAPLNVDAPERGSAPTAVQKNAHQKQLDKMEAEWAKKGGDRTEIQKFKREHGLK